MKFPAPRTPGAAWTCRICKDIPHVLIYSVDYLLVDRGRHFADSAVAKNLGLIGTRIIANPTIGLEVSRPLVLIALAYLGKALRKPARRREYAEA